MTSGKKVMVALLLIMGMSSVLDNVAGVMTIGDSTFPLDQGDVKLWTVMNGSSGYVKGDKFKLTVNSVTSGTHASVDCMMVNATIEYFNNGSSEWQELQGNSRYMAHNYSQDYLNFSTFVMTSKMAFIAPTPLNLTMIANALNDSGYVIEGTTINLTRDDGEFALLTYNSSGYLTRYEIMESGVSTMVMVAGNIELDLPQPTSTTPPNDDVPFFQIIIVVLTCIMGSIIITVLFLKRDELRERLGKMGQNVREMRQESPKRLKDLKHNPHLKVEEKGE